MKIQGFDLPKSLALTAVAGAILISPISQINNAYAGGIERANLAFNVFIGSSKMFKIKFVTDLTKDTYNSRMELKPKGIAKLFANIRMEMSAAGKLINGKILPTSFSFYRKKDKKKKKSSMAWASDGSVATKRSYKVKPLRQENIKKAIGSNVPDPLSAFLRLGITDAKTPCIETQRIYDGGKVYDLTFKLLKKVTFDSKSNGVYNGPAFKCQLNHKPVAGYSTKDLRKLKKNPAVFLVWFAPVTSALLNKSILLPIAAAGTLKGRSFSAYANKATFAGKPL